MNRRRRWLRRVIPFALFSVPAIALTFVSSHEGKRSFGRVFISQGVVWYYWALITPAILAVAERFPLESLRRLKGIAAHLGAALVAGALCGLLGAVAIIATGGDLPERFTTTPQFLVLSTILWTCFGLVFYSMIVCVGF